MGHKLHVELRGHPQLSRMTGTLTSGLTPALRVPTMAVPLSSAPGPRPTGSWAGAHWAKGPATCCACGSAHAHPSPAPGREGLRAPSPGSRAQTSWVSRRPDPSQSAALISGLGWGLRAQANGARGCIRLSLASTRHGCHGDPGTLPYRSGRCS